MANRRQADSMRSSCRGGRRLMGAASSPAMTTTSRRVITSLIISIVLGSLFAFAVAASFSALPPRHKPQQQLPAQQLASFLLVPEDGEGLESDDELDKNWLALSRLMSSGDDEVKAYLRQYLKEERQRKQKESAILEQLASSTGDAFGRQSPRAQGYQEREAYVLVDSPPSSSLANDLNDLELSSSGDVETSQSNVVVAAPSGFEPSQDNQQNEQQLTVDNYELIKTLLADKANADDEQQLVGLNQKRQDDHQSDSGQQRRRNTYTTLLEDEQQDGLEDEEQTKTAATETTTATYGEIVYSQAPRETSSLSGILSRVWDNLTYYLPFLNQFSFWKQDDAPKTSGQGHSNELRAKLSVSVTTAQNKSALSDQEDGQSEENEVNDKRQKVDVKENVSSKDEQQQQQQQQQQDNREANGDNDDFSGQFAPVKEPTVKAADDGESQPKHGARKNSNSKRISGSLQLDDGQDLEMDMDQMVPMVAGVDGGSVSGDQGHDEHSQGHQNQNRYNLMRHSSLVVPLGSGQDVLLSAGLNKDPSDSLLGKYIYAPTHHYYLNSGSGHHVPASVNGKRPQPDDEIYGSYGGANNGATHAAYQKDSAMSSMGNKSNDLYFLIMVGAFCMMAMAVVLAAGMFAYRVQQHRKSSQDQDYPTYGVVGPNNLSGAKCGAAAFVGGSIKSGSVKHLPDLYHHHGASAGGSDSGLNSLDRSSAAAKKASSASSLSEHNNQNGQTTGSRTAPSNFMVAASQDAARMYHYQHQKQQMISDRNSGGRHTSASDLDSEDENDDGSYTVYECPGLASAHEMEIKNPLFNDDQSP